MHRLCLLHRALRTIALGVLLAIGLAFGSFAVVTTARAVSPGEAAGVTLTTDQDLITDFQTRVPVHTRITDAAGSPVAGMPVTFRLDIPEAGRLSLLTALTDEQGLATTTFIPTFFRGDVTITGSVASGMADQTMVGIYCGC